jgi:uncharacterized membrane protein
MTSGENLWAVAFDAPNRAAEVCAELRALEERQFLLVEDMAVVVRDHDGSFRVEREGFPYLGNIAGCSLAGFLAGLVVLAPLAGAALGALVGGSGSAIAATQAGISEEFIREVQALMKPGSSALFLLDAGGDLEVVDYQIRGLGGTILKTNVDPARAREVQAALAAPSPDTPTGEARG